MPRRWTKLLAIAAVVTSACRGPAGVDGITVTESDSSGVAMITVVGDPSLLPSWTLSETAAVEISGHAAPFLTDIGEVAFRTDGGFVVEDNRSAEVHHFDAHGVPVRLLGGFGDGPGEFRNVTQISVTPGDTVFAFDRRHSRLSVFGPEGELGAVIDVGRDALGVGSLSFDAWAFDSERVLLHGLGPLESQDTRSGPHIGRRQSLLSWLGPDREMRSPHESFLGGHTLLGQRFDGASPFASEAVVAIGREMVVHGPGVEYELHAVPIGPGDRRIIRWVEWRRPVSAAEVEATREVIAAGLEQLRQARPDRVAALLDAMFDPAAIPDSLAALGRVLVDDEDRVWVSRFSPSTRRWHEEDAWHILDESGRPVARLRLPPDARLLAVREGRAAVVMRDELEVQHLRVFDIVSEEAR